MKIEYGLYQQQTQKLMMTPELRQAITILQYPAIELMEYIQEQMVENPVLDIDEKEWERYRYLYQNSRQVHAPSSQNDDDRNIWDMIASPEENLEEHLLQQARLLNLDSGEFRTIKFLIGNLDDMGYFTVSSQEVAQSLNVTIQSVEEMLNLLQSFEPLGVGSRDLKEFLLIQLQQMESFDLKANEVVENYLQELGEKNIQKLHKG